MTLTAKIADSLALIVPAYNNARFLPDLVASVYGGMTSLGFMHGQTVAPTELIVCDDCSEDNTREVVKSLSDLHSRVKYCRTPRNSGTSAACNVAIDHTNCEIITRIDSDDMREFWSYEFMLKKLEENPHSMIYDDVMIFLNGKRKGKNWRMEDYDFETLLKRNIIHAGIMYPKTAWRECGGYPEIFSNGRDDWAFNVALGSKGYCGAHVEKPGYLYRREQQNRSLKNSSSEYQKYYHDMMRKQFPDLYSGRFEMGCCGNRKSKVSSISSSSSSTSVPVVGSEGMTLVHYEGENFGSESYFGPVTGSVYTFSATKNMKYVDKRDLRTPRGTGLLDLVSHGKLVFTETQAPKPAVVTTTLRAPVAEVKVEEKIAIPADQPMIAETAIEDSAEETPIKAGDVVGIGQTSISKLFGAGIDTWEKFVNTDSSKLGLILKKSVADVEAMKSSLLE
jgi:glycosyltransferase involved in cell wall biosynthesis